ncbi:choice-of-anchor M domain-containing protein [Streptomyces nodosus]|uniref:choice-of-anchor M domain-containing protein n=1 Tax=Streptomyces nodosus TaxID=40318 RepID=UPI003830C323
MGSLTRTTRVAGVLALAAAGLVSVGAVGGAGTGPGATVNAVVPVADAVPDGVHAERVVIDNGHVDAMAPRLVGGEFRTLFRDSRTSEVVWREPTSVIMHLTSKGKEVVPDPAGGLDFIGKPGDTYYTIPQTQNPEVLWAGWSTEEFQPADIQGKFELSLDSLEGPGSLLVFGWSPFGEPLMRFDSRDGLPDVYKVSARTHEHANWVFTQQGVYRMTFTFKVKLASGEDVSDSQVFTMVVGDVDPAGVPLPGEEGGPGDGDDGGSGPTDGGSDGDTGGGATDGGSDDGGASDGGADGGAADGGSGQGGSTEGATDGGSYDGGSSDGGADGGASDGGAAQGGTDGGMDDGGVTGGATDGGATGGSTGGSTVGGATVPDTSGGTDAVDGGGTAPSGSLAATGAGVALPLGAGALTLVAAGAGTALYVRRRQARTAVPGDADQATAS